MKIKLQKLDKMISKDYWYYISLLLYASNIAICSEELHNFDQQMTDYETLFSNFAPIHDFEFDEDFLQYCINTIDEENNDQQNITNSKITDYNLTQQQLQNSSHQPSVLAVVDTIIDKNNQLSNQRINLSRQELQKCKDEQIKALNQTGDKNLATKAYRKTYDTLRRAKPEYKEKEKLRIVTHEYKEKDRLRKAKPEYKEKNKLYRATPEFKQKRRERYYKKTHNITQQQPINNSSALSLMPAIIATQDHSQNIHFETASISDYYNNDYFEKFIDNNTISTS